MQARIISSELDEGGAVTLAIGGVQIAAMDHLGYGASEQAVPNVGEDFVVSFSCLFGDGVSWNDVFSGNPDGRSELVGTGMWSYLAYGALAKVDGTSGEAVAKCGLCDLPLPIEVTDSALVGSSVAFKIQRLDAWRA